MPGGYPDDGLGVCTDVIWQALQAAGYDLKALVDADIAACPEAYPHITTPRPQHRLPPGQHLGYLLPPPCAGADLRPVGWAAVAAGGISWCSVTGPSIGLCSDRRNRQGIPFLIHHGNPIDEAVERNDIPPHDGDRTFPLAGLTGKEQNGDKKDIAERNFPSDFFAL